VIAEAQSVTAFRGGEMTAQSEHRHRGTVVAVTAIVALAVTVSFLYVSRGLNRPSTPAGTQPAADVTSAPTPADKSTFQPPSDEPSESWTWPTGVQSEIEAPLSSSAFVGTNGWTGYLGDQRLTIVAGIPGYDHPKDGALFVASLRPEGGIDKSFMKVVDGVGALTNVSGKDNAGLQITSESGQDFYYDLSSQTLTKSS